MSTVQSGQLVSTVQSGKLAKCSSFETLTNLSSPSCVRRGAGGDRDPGRWGKGVIDNTALSPTEWFLH